MTEQKQTPSFVAPIKATALALIGFTGCFFTVASRSSSSPLLALIVTLLAEVAFIALAVREWVRYFRAYVTSQIDQRLKEPSYNR